MNNQHVMNMASMNNKSTVPAVLGGVLPALLAAAITLASCSSDDAASASAASEMSQSVAEGARVPIALTANAVGQTTRALDNTLQGTQLSQNQLVYVWIDEHKKPNTEHDNHAAAEHVADRVCAWKLTADGNGRFYPHSSSASANVDDFPGWAESKAHSVRYYPSSGFPVDIFALHGNFYHRNGDVENLYTLTEGATEARTSEEGGMPTVNPSDVLIPEEASTWNLFTENLVHRVLQNQSNRNLTAEIAKGTELDAGRSGNESDGAALTDGYQQSDLMYARAYTKPRQDDAHNLTFTHLLSKIEVYLIPGKGMRPDRIYQSPINETTSVRDGKSAWFTTVEILNTRRSAKLALHKTSYTGSFSALVDTDNMAFDSGSSSESNPDPITNQYEGTDGKTYTRYYDIEPVGDKTGEIYCRMQYDLAGVDIPTGVTTSSSERKAYALAEAVIVPQVVSSDGTKTGTDVNLFRISMPSGGEFYLKSNHSLMYQTGKRYKYYVTLSEQGLDVILQVQDWVNGTTELGDDDSGSGSME